MVHLHCKVDLPKSHIKLRKIFDEAKSKSFHFHVDEKGTVKHPSVWQRKLSDKTYEEAWDIIINNKPHITCYYRNLSYINKKEQDYWEFGMCNIGSNSYGEVFIWINVDVETGYELITKYKLKENWY